MAPSNLRLRCKGALCSVAQLCPRNHAPALERQPIRFAQPCPPGAWLRVFIQRGHLVVVLLLQARLQLYALTQPPAAALLLYINSPSQDTFAYINTSLHQEIS
jgi:hypothetical protein